MVDLKDIGYVKGLKSNMRAVFESEAGKNIMEFLELSCGWYQSPIIPGNEQLTQVAVGRREVLATIKTILKFDATAITDMAKRKENG